MSRIAAWTFGALVIAAPSVTAAAVRQCGAPVAGEIAEAAIEAEAKRKALASWKAKADLLGKGYRSWRIATAKKLACVRTKAHTFRCAAVAVPCTIRQNPKPPTPSKGGGIDV